jgi:repressor LexA
MRMQNLTTLQERVLTLIQRAVRRTGKAPTYREIAGEMGVTVRSAFQHVQALERKGLLERVNGAIELAEEYRLPQGTPVLGRVAAGSPILAEQNLDEHVDLGRQFENEDVFLLRVRGDSMIEAGINDGDMVLTRRQERVEDGEIAVVVIGEEATVKKVRFHRGGLSLEPANPKYKPIELGDEEEVRIAGKVLMAVKVFGG